MQYQIPIMLVAATTVVPRLVNPAAPMPVDVVREASVLVRDKAVDERSGDKSDCACGTRPNDCRVGAPNAVAN